MTADEIRALARSARDDADSIELGRIAVLLLGELAAQVAEQNQRLDHLDGAIAFAAGHVVGGVGNRIAAAGSEVAKEIERSRRPRKPRPQEGGFEWQPR